MLKLPVYVLLALLAPPSQQTVATPKEQPKTTGQSQPAQPAINVTVQSPEPNPEVSKAEREDRQRNLDIQDRIATYTGLLLLSAIVQAVVGLGAFFVGIRAANAAKQSAKVATDALHLTERAYVDLDGWSPDMPNGGPATLKFTISNSGRSPASMVVVKSGFRRGGPFPKMPEIDYQSLPDSTALGFDVPGGKSERVEVPLNLTADDWTDFKVRRSGGLQVFGYVLYRDVFGHAFRRKFAVHIDDRATVATGPYCGEEREPQNDQPTSN